MRAKDFKELIKDIPDERDVLFIDLKDERYYLSDDPEKLSSVCDTVFIRIKQSRLLGLLPSGIKDFRELIKNIPNDTDILFSDYLFQRTYHLSDDPEKVLNEGHNILLRIRRDKSVRTLLPRYQDIMWDGTP